MRIKKRSNVDDRQFPEIVDWTLTESFSGGDGMWLGIQWTHCGEINFAVVPAARIFGHGVCSGCFNAFSFRLPDCPL